MIPGVAARAFRRAGLTGREIRPMAAGSLGLLQQSYDRAARAYSRRSFHELRYKPLDRRVLDLFADRVEGLVCDLGCGPGQVARYLRDRGVQVTGMDLSQGMLEQARQLSPDIPFQQGDMFALPVEDESWGGIAAFYSIIHSPRAAVPELLREWKRALRPGGWLLLSFHLGMGVGWADHYAGVPVAIETTFFLTREMGLYLTRAGFHLESWVERPHYATASYWESPSFRGYILARKRSGGP